MITAPVETEIQPATVRTRPIRVVSIIEADFVTGQAKNLIEFAVRAAPDIHFTIVGYLRGGEPETKYLQAARAAGLDVHVIHERGRFDWSVTESLRQLVAELKPDFIETNNVKSHFFVRASGVWKKTKWLAFHHGYTWTDFKMRLYNLVDYWSLRKAYYAVAVCGPWAQQMIARGVDPSRVHVQHNSIKPFVPLAQAPTRPSADPIIVSIGRLSKEKGHVDLVEALGLLAARNVPFHAVFVGEGPERASIEATAQRLGVASRITLAGLQHDVRPYYEMADIVALPSHSEGSPLVLLEAMVASKPIVATRVGGVPEIAQDQRDSLLVAAHDPKAMADALQRLLTDADLRQKLSAGARRVADSHSPEWYRESMLGLYRRLVEAPR